MNLLRRVRKVLFGMVKCWLETWKIKRGRLCKDPGEEPFRKKMPSVQKGFGMVMSLGCPWTGNSAWVARAVSGGGVLDLINLCGVCVCLCWFGCLLSAWNGVDHSQQLIIAGLWPLVKNFLNIVFSPFISNFYLNPPTYHIFQSMYVASGVAVEKFGHSDSWALDRTFFLLRNEHVTFVSCILRF